MKKILIFDNYDSFTYNLLHLVKKLGYTQVDVVRNDQIALEEIEKYDKILLSPGPGIPSESGILLEVIGRYAATKSILGVCLGHQAIGESFGATLLNLTEVFHGIATPIQVTANDPLFEGITPHFEAGRYHSWVIEQGTLPPCLECIACDDSGEIMAIRHREYDVRGIQFHPESVLTPEGEKIVENWLKQD